MARGRRDCQQQEWVDRILAAGIAAVQLKYREGLRLRNILALAKGKRGGNQ